MNSIMTVMTYIIYEYEGCRHSKGPILFRGGATHYSDGEGSLTIHMVRGSTVKAAIGHSLIHMPTTQ